MTENDLRSRLLKLACRIAERLTEDTTQYSTQDLHNVTSAYFIMKPYSGASALDAGYSRNPVDVSEPGLLTNADSESP